MSVPERMVLQPCPVLGWDSPDRVKYVIAPGAEYVHIDLLTAMTAERDALLDALNDYISDTAYGGNVEADTAENARAALALINKEAINN